MQRTFCLIAVLISLHLSRNGYPNKWMATAAIAPSRSVSVFRRSFKSVNSAVPVSFSVSSSRHLPSEGDGSIPTYKGPIFSPTEDFASPPEMSAILELAELGFDIAVGPSMIVPGQLGLYGRCSYGIDSVSLPECTLLCGYSKSGVFRSFNVGDRTVGFSLTTGNTAVFFDRELMEVQDALAKAATDCGHGACGLAGHELSLSCVSDLGETLTIHPSESSFERYFCPEDVYHNDGTLSINVQNFGQYCNDLAWNQLSPPLCLDEYMERSSDQNCVQLVWRLEYDPESSCLVPPWPVSVLSRDVRFENREFMELGTRYGWNYWQATVQIEDIV
jgi:hypothetical protein